MTNIKTCNWRFVKSYINTDIWVFECPICHSKVEILADENVADKFPFCRCGADMRSKNKFQNLENKFKDLVVFDDQPKRQLEDPYCHNEL